MAHDIQTNSSDIKIIYVLLALAGLFTLLAFSSFFFPVASAIALAIICGLIPGLFVGCVGIFSLILGGMIMTPKILKELIHFYYVIGAYVGQAVYPLALVAMPFITIALAALAAALLGATVVLGMGCVIDKHSAEKKF